MMKAIYDDLRRLAVSHMSSERPDHTLQPTALVHEAYLKPRRAAFDGLG
ncbi:MAG: ECF-type sigma factor [Phycisphaerae bacterium]